MRPVQESNVKRRLSMRLDPAYSISAILILPPLLTDE